MVSSTYGMETVKIDWADVSYLHQQVIATHTVGVHCRAVPKALKDLLLRPEKDPLVAATQAPI